MHFGLQNKTKHHYTMESIDKKTNIDPNDIVRVVNQKIGKDKVTTGINWDNVSPMTVMPAIDASRKPLVLSKKLCEILSISDSDSFNLSLFEIGEGCFIGIEENHDCASIPFFRKYISMESVMPVTHDADYKSAVLQMIEKIIHFAKGADGGILTVKTSEPIPVKMEGFDYTLYEIKPLKRSEIGKRHPTTAAIRKNFG